MSPASGIFAVNRFGGGYDMSRNQKTVVILFVVLLAVLFALDFAQLPVDDTATAAEPAQPAEFTGVAYLPLVLVERGGVRQIFDVAGRLSPAAESRHPAHAGGRRLSPPFLRHQDYGRNR